MGEPTLIINEMFHSIQGESLYAGCPCIFIRLTGCNLRCTYCDTTYAFHEGAELSLDRIVENVSSWPCKMVEITGGEPLYQKNTPQLIHRLIDKGYTVLMETNGSYDLESIDKRCIKIVDVKCPSSGESHRNHDENFKSLGPLDQIKFVIRDSEDYRFSKHILETHSFPFDAHNILFSPVSCDLPPQTLARWILEDGLSVRLHLQLHKFIWPTVERGV